MAAGDVRQGNFSRVQADGRTTIAALIGGTSYLLLKIRAGGCILIGNNLIDPAGSDTTKGYRLTPGEEFSIDDGGNTASTLIDPTKINIFAVEGPRPVSINIFAIDDA